MNTVLKSLELDHLFQFLLRKHDHESAPYYYETIFSSAEILAISNYIKKKMGSVDLSKQFSQQIIDKVEHENETACNDLKEKKQQLCTLLKTAGSVHLEVIKNGAIISEQHHKIQQVDKSKLIFEPSIYFSSVNAMNEVTSHVCTHLNMQKKTATYLFKIRVDGDDYEIRNKP